MNDVKVKICGITTENDIMILNCDLPDYAGFVFYEKSKRHLEYDEARRLISMLDPNIRRVAVCVSPDMQRIAEIKAIGFDILQIHGTLTMDMISAWPGEIWQAVNISGTKIPEVIYHEKITGYVVDGANYGGGEPFAWEDEALISNFRSLKKNDELLILAGGLDPDNVAEGIRIFRPDVVDVSTGVEGEVGKNPSGVMAFIKTAREVEVSTKYEVRST